MKNPCNRRLSQPPQQPPRSDVLASTPSLQYHIARAPKGENRFSIKETLMAVAISVFCILSGWAHLIRLYFNFEIWCRKYLKTYPSVKEKLYRFTVFKEKFENRNSMPNGFGDRTDDELEYLLPSSYDDSDSENEFTESLYKRHGNMYQICEENNKVVVHCYGTNTYHDSDIKEENKFFERLKRHPGLTYQVCKETDTLSCSANRCVDVADELKLFTFES